MDGRTGGQCPGEHGSCRGSHAMGLMGGSCEASETAAASTAAARTTERDALLREFMTHSLHIEAQDDPEERSREIVEHE